MLLKDRRVIFGLGAALLVGGLGLMYAITKGGGDDLEEVALAIVFYSPGVVTMAVGAGLIGFAALRKSE